MQQAVREDLIRMLEVLKSKGGTHCTGSCYHRKPEEFHCHELARMLGFSSQGVKNRLLALVEMGLVEVQLVERGSSGPVARMTITAQGDELLARRTP